MFDNIKALIQRWNEVREIDALTDRDLGDMGVSRAQVEAFVRMPRDVPDRVLTMAAIFGLSETEVQANHAEWLQLLETCSTCDDRGGCKLLLERGALSQAHACSFCPNAHTFEAKATIA